VELDRDCDSTFHITRAHILFRRCYHGRLAMIGSPTTWWRLPEEWASESGKLLVQLRSPRLLKRSPCEQVSLRERPGNGTPVWLGKSTYSTAKP